MAKAKKLPSGNWRVQASKTVNGIQMRKSFTAETKRQAELIAMQWAEGTTEENKIENITLAQAYERYIQSKENILSPSTIAGYKSLTKTSFSEIMSFPIANLSQPTIQKTVNNYSLTHSPKGVKNAVGLLMSVIGMFRPNFNIKITTPQKEKTAMYIPDDEDIKKVLEAVKSTRLEIPVLLAAFGPMRRGEICALTSDDIHGNIVTVNKSLVRNSSGNWHIKPPKTFSSYREIEYPDFVINALKGITGNITDMTPNAISDAFLKMLRKNHITEFRFHDLRHYAVSTLHAINIPDKYIMARGGWATNYTMNNVYNHALRSKKDEYTAKITVHFDSIYK